MKTFKQFIKKIERDNKKFEKLSNAEKRVEIARDALLRIKFNNIFPNRGAVFARIFDNGELKSQINSESIQCIGCAKGALFASYIGRVNNFFAEDLSYDAHIRSNEMQTLSKIFTPLQLNAIECAFENRVFSWSSSSVDPSDILFLYDASHYRERLALSHSFEELTDDQAFISICKNIIKNGGEFVPSDLVKPNARIS